MAGMFKDAADPAAGMAAWRLPFMIAGALCVIAAVCILMVKPLPSRSGEARASEA